MNNRAYIFPEEINNIENWFDVLSDDIEKLDLIDEKFSTDLNPQFLRPRLLINSPAESNNNSYLQVKDVPVTNLDEASSSGNSMVSTVSNETVKDFWKQLIYQIKERESERERFETKPENINKTKKQLIEEFDKASPKILNKLAELWNKILEPAGLEFDLENVTKPIHLRDNLKAYLKIKSTKEKINYNQLSTGIRNFIFRLGHIYS